MPTKEVINPNKPATKINSRELLLRFFDFGEKSKAIWQAAKISDIAIMIWRVELSIKSAMYLPNKVMANAIQNIFFTISSSTLLFLK